MIYNLISIVSKSSDVAPCGPAVHGRMVIWPWPWWGWDTGRRSERKISLLDPKNPQDQCPQLWNSRMLVHNIGECFFWDAGCWWVISVVKTSPVATWMMTWTASRCCRQPVDQLIVGQRWSVLTKYSTSWCPRSLLQIDSICANGYQYFPSTVKSYLDMWNQYPPSSLLQKSWQQLPQLKISCSLIDLPCENQTIGESSNMPWGVHWSK